MMRRHCARTLTQTCVTGLCLAVALSVGTHALAQGRQTGTLRGSVQDSTAAALPGVTVTVRSRALQGTRSAVTAPNGSYELLGLPNGNYIVTFELQGFNTVANTVSVPLGGTVEANVSMPIAGVTESVLVTAVVPTPLASTETSQNITDDEVTALPVGRTPFLIAELAPGPDSQHPEQRAGRHQRFVRVRQRLPD